MGIFSSIAKAAGGVLGKVGGTILGTAIGGPIGGTVGGKLGAIVGGKAAGAVVGGGGSKGGGSISAGGGGLMSPLDLGGRQQITQSEGAVQAAQTVDVGSIRLPSAADFQNNEAFKIWEETQAVLIAGRNM